MEVKKEKIQIDVIRTGGLMAQNRVLKRGLTITKADWEGLKRAHQMPIEQVGSMPDTYIYKLSFENEELILPEHSIPPEWKRKFQKIDKELDGI